MLHVDLVWVVLRLVATNLAAFSVGVAGSPSYSDRIGVPLAPMASARRPPPYGGGGGGAPISGQKSG